VPKEQTRLTAIMPAVVISHIQALQFGSKMDFSRFTLLISTNSVYNGVSQSSCFYELCNLLESKCMKVLQTKICVDRLVFMEITSKYIYLVRVQFSRSSDAVHYRCNYVRLQFMCLIEKALNLLKQ